jgi:hypothetical protein
LGKLRQCVVRAAKFESTDALKVFTLKEQLRPGLIVRRSRLQHGRDVRDGLQTAMRRDDIFE